MIEVVAGVLTRPDGRVLTCRRAPDRPAAGQWEFPGGKVEPGELAAEALRRELHEELGLDVVVGEPIDRSLTRVGNVHIDLATYRVAWAADGPMLEHGPRRVALGPTRRTRLARLGQARSARSEDPG